MTTAIPTGFMTSAPRPTFSPRASSVATGAEAAPAITVRDFHFSYGKREVLKRLNFDIARRGVTAIIGPSGCGKSTFLRSVNRLNDLIPGTRQQGDILIDGLSVYERDTDLVVLRQRVGMVFQRPNPFPKSIFENVAYGPTINALVPKSDLPDLVEQSLRQAALWDEVKDRLESPGTGLSGGQQQRLCIARTIAPQPEVVLLDEPTSALDPQGTQRIEELLYHLKSQFTIVIVTHNMQQAARVSDTTSFFYLGTLVETGVTRQIFTAPREEKTEAYITGRFG